MSSCHWRGLPVRIFIALSAFVFVGFLIRHNPALIRLSYGFRLGGSRRKGSDFGGFPMRMMPKGLFLAGAFCAATAQAETSAIMGPGAVLCAEFNRGYRAAGKKIEDHFFTWAQGFMSGVNDALYDTVGYRDLRSLSVAQQKQSLRAFCLQNPTSKYRDAIPPLLKSMKIVPSTTGSR
jgi:hypothetical protein